MGSKTAEPVIFSHYRKIEIFEIPTGHFRLIKSEILRILHAKSNRVSDLAEALSDNALSIRSPKGFGFYPIIIRRPYYSRR